ncbi:Carboxylesterase family protein [Cryptosporidium meleagridis]|uniref:Carboxylesterase family protein n=1 Tax=Cryptosporidium meleagridis TaxID=93969 RepID=A0A2P4Z4R9_9CRYT|nr:Carboxylesterase family protein [Cryptosporidium meleagridis]
MKKNYHFKIITNLLLILFFYKIEVFESVEIEGIQLIGRKNNGITSFYNIRYGVANRFQPPKLLSITEAVIMDEDRTSKIPKSYDLSTNKGSSCPQDCSDTQQTSQKTFLCRGTEPETQSEACLTLSVFTATNQIEEILSQFSTVAKHVSPNNTQINMLSNVNNTLMNNLNKQKSSISSIVQANMSSLKPVYVFIHGGLYLFGSSNSETNFGEKLAESGAVIVTINYRLGILGWLRTKNLSSGNMGFLDQRIALEWIHKYIVHFGGDPNRIILAGHSAGAKSVLCHSVTEESNKYFSGVIIHSGALSQNETALKEAENMGEIAENIASEKCLATILSCTTKQLLEIQKEVRAQIVRSNPSKALHSWSPIVDGVIIKDSCRNLALSGSIPKSINVIISTTNSEGVQFFRSFIAYLPAISRGLATSNFAFRYLVSRVFGPKAGEAMKIYSNNNFANSASIASDHEKSDTNHDLQNNTNINHDNSSYVNNETTSNPIETQKEDNETMTGFKADDIKYSDKENNQIVSSSGFNLLQVGRNRDEEKWNGIIDDPVALAYARMIGDFIYSCPARMFIKKLSQYNPNVYGYFVNSGFKWTEGLKKGYEVNNSSFISEIFQAPKFSLRNTPKGVVCQNDDVACKTYVYDCSDTRLVCHMEDMIWLFQTFPNKLNDNIDRVFINEQNLASTFFSQLIKKSLGEAETLSKKQQQIFRKSSFSESIDISSDVSSWDSFSDGGKILQLNGNRTELVSDFKSEECELWEWRNNDLSMTFHQLIDSKTIPQSKNVDSSTFTGVSRNDENESKNLNINLIDENIENPASSLSDDQFSQISILTQNDTEKDISDNSNISGNEEF